MPSQASLPHSAAPVPFIRREQWLADVIDRHGSPIAGVPGAYRIRTTQADLASELGITPSSMQDRLRRAQRAGFVVSTRPLVLRDPFFDPSDDGGGVADEGGPCLSPVLVAGLQAALDAVRDEDDLAVFAQLAKAVAVSAGGSEPYAGSAADSAGPRVVRGATAGDDSREKLEVRSSFNSSNSLLEPSVPADQPRGSRVSAERRTKAEINALVAPLVELCRLNDLPGMGRWTGVAEALESFDDVEVAAGVAAAAALIKAGRLKSPFGWLVAAARDTPEVFEPRHITLVAKAEETVVDLTHPADAATATAAIQAARRATAGA